MPPGGPNRPAPLGQRAALRRRRQYPGHHPGGLIQKSDGSSAQTDKDKGKEAYSPDVDPADFADKVDNKYFPLKPGTTFIYKGKDAEGFEHIEVSVTNGTKRVIGVECAVLRARV